MSAREGGEAAGKCAELCFAIHPDSEREAELYLYPSVWLEGGPSRGGRQINGKKTAITERRQVHRLHMSSGVGVTGEKKQISVATISDGRQLDIGRVILTADNMRRPVWPALCTAESQLASDIKQRDRS